MRVFFLQDYQTEATSMRRILFLSKVSPPRVLAAITLRKNFDDLEFEAFGNCYKHNQATVAITFPKADPHGKQVGKNYNGVRRNKQVRQEGYSHHARRTERV
jgi:hypothetical protein